MKAGSLVKQIVAVALVVSFCLPRGILWAASSPRPTTFDLALQRDGLLVGQVIDANGMPQAHVPVTLYADNRELGSTTTNDQGVFAFEGVRSGVYTIAAADGVAQYRVWQPRLAPPGAAQNAVVVARQDLTRGQVPGRLGMFLSRPLVIAGVVAAAIAIPLAIALSDDEEAPATP